MRPMSRAEIATDERARASAEAADRRFQQSVAKSLVEGHDMPSGYKGGRWQWLRDTGRIGLVSAAR